MSMALTSSSEATMYKNNSLSGPGVVSRGRLAWSFFGYENASWHLGVQSILLLLDLVFSNWKKGLHFFAVLVMKLLKAFILPLSYCTSRMVWSGVVLRIASIFFGIGWIPFFPTKNHRNFPFCIPKLHLAGLSLMSYLSRLSMVTSKSWGWLLKVLYLNNMSSTYTKTFLQIWCLNTVSINLWKVSPTLCSLNGMTL